MTTFDLIFTICNEVVKVMFLHLSVCPQGEYLCRYPLGPGTPPRTRYTPLGPGTPLPRTRYTPLGRYSPGPGAFPQDQVHPHPLGPSTSPMTRYTPHLRPVTPPWDQVHPKGAGTPPTMHTPQTRSTPSRWLLLWMACIRKAT